MSLEATPRAAQERQATLPLLRRLIGEFVRPYTGYILIAHDAELLRERGAYARLYALQFADQAMDEPSLRAVQAS